MSWEPNAYKDYQWIVADPQLLGGKLAIRGTRLSVALILESLATVCPSTRLILHSIVPSRMRPYPRS